MHGQWLLPIAVHQQPTEGTDKRLMRDQQYLVTTKPLQFCQALARIALGGQPGNGTQLAGQTKRITHKGGCLLSAYIRADENRLQGSTTQVLKRLPNLVPAIIRQLTHLIASSLGMCLAMAQ